MSIISQALPANKSESSTVSGPAVPSWVSPTNASNQTDSLDIDSQLDCQPPHQPSHTIILHSCYGYFYDVLKDMDVERTRSWIAAVQHPETIGFGYRYKIVVYWAPEASQYDDTFSLTDVLLAAARILHVCVGRLSKPFGGSIDVGKRRQYHTKVYSP